MRPPSTYSKDEKDEKFALGRKGILVVLTLCVLTLMAALDGTSLSVALPVSEQIPYTLWLNVYIDFLLDHGGGITWNGHRGLLEWNFIPALLDWYDSHIRLQATSTDSSTVFQPSFASFSNIFGRRPMILIALVFFCVGAIVAAVAKNFTYMLVGRSIQGVGGGGIIALSEVIITDLIPLRWRGQYFGILSAMWSVGSVTGPILGGGFAENVTWVRKETHVLHHQDLTILACRDGSFTSTSPSSASALSSSSSS